MNKVLADYLQRQKVGLKAEATALAAIADKDTAGVLTAEQDTRIKAIEADCALIDTQIAAANAEAETPEAMAARLRAEIADVTAACALAGKPARASAFITAGTPLKQVVSTLHAEAATAAGEDINQRNPGKLGGGSLADAATVEANWKASVEKVNAMYGFKRG